MGFREPTFFLAHLVVGIGRRADKRLAYEPESTLESVTGPARELVQ